VGGANVLLLVSGGIAAYKACYLTRLLMQAGFSVRVGMTAAARRFVQPMTFRVLSGHPVAEDLWEVPLDHIDLARWADLAVIAPATANLIAKAAHGIADDIVSTLLLACERPLLVAPAMNDAMWRHPATQANLALLRERGATIVEPGTGFLACGVVAEGRLADPEEILAVVLRRSAELGRRPAAEGAPAGLWTGRRVVVTAGPTWEAIDAVRFIGNRSTGALGYAIAAEAAARGAAVTLITGPVGRTIPPGVTRIVRVESAEQMAAAVREALAAGADWLFMAAAVADFTPARIARGKIKKESLGTAWSLELKRTTEILGDVVDPERHDRLRVVAFALETEQVLERAAEKLRAKGADFIVANNPTAPDSSFGDGSHRVYLLGPEGLLWDSGSLEKREIAAGLLERLAAGAKPAART
jgi:phosphopantothenoylcysteine decarboxylase/phosphopantothenate--cysteine ligase